MKGKGKEQGAKLYLHGHEFHGGQELVVNPEFFPFLSEGSVVEVRSREGGSLCANSNLLLNVVSLPLAVKGKMQISILKEVAQAFDLKAFTEVTVRTVSRQDVEIDFVELTFKDQYLSRMDLWYLKKSIIGEAVYTGKHVRKNGIRLQVQEIRKSSPKEQGSNAVVNSGVISTSTKLVFRSKSARLVWFIQMSPEMWDMDNNGDLYLEVFLRFIGDLCKKWQSVSVSHTLTILFFSRSYYDDCQFPDDFYADGVKNSSYEHLKSICKDEEGRFYEDFYKIVTYDQLSMNISDILPIVKKELNEYPHLARWRSRFGQSGMTSNFESNSVKPNKSLPYGIPSNAIEGNLLEGINLVLNIFEKHFLDRNLYQSGQNMVLITAGNGIFRVNRQLEEITEQRMMDNGIGIDLISLSSPPLHNCPVFLFKDVQDDINDNASSIQLHSNDYFNPSAQKQNFHRTERSSTTGSDGIFDYTDQQCKSVNTMGYNSSSVRHQAVCTQCRDSEGYSTNCSIPLWVPMRFIGKNVNSTSSFQPVPFCRIFSALRTMKTSPSDLPRPLLAVLNNFNEPFYQFINDINLPFPFHEGINSSMKLCVDWECFKVEGENEVLPKIGSISPNLNPLLGQADRAVSSFNLVHEKYDDNVFEVCQLEVPKNYNVSSPSNSLLKVKSSSKDSSYSISDGYYPRRDNSSVSSCESGDSYMALHLGHNLRVGSSEKNGFSLKNNLASVYSSNSSVVSLFRTHSSMGLKPGPQHEYLHHNYHDVIYKRFTSNRRRWSHLYLPSSDSYNDNFNVTEFATTRSIDWKSLSFPAILPLTTDFYPSSYELKAHYTEYFYTLTLPALDELYSELTPVDCPIYQNYNDLLLEMVNQRFSQDFQIYVEDSNKDLDFLFNVSKPASENEIKIDTAPPICKTNYSRNRSSVKNSSSMFSTSTKKKSNSMGSSHDPTFRLTMGHRVHEIVFNEDSQSIKVKRFLQRASKKSDTDKLIYNYSLWCTLTNSFLPAVQEFRKYPEMEYSWNYLDQLVCGYYDEMGPSTNYRRIAFCVLPPKNIEDSTDFCDKFKRFIDYIQSRTYSKGKRMEVNISPGDTKEVDNVKVSGKSSFKILFSTKDGNPRKQWVVIKYDSNLFLDQCFHLEVQWLVCGSSLVDDFVTGLHRRAKQLNIDFVSVPEMAVSCNLNLHPLINPAFIPISSTLEIEMLEGQIIHLFDFVAEGVHDISKKYFDIPLYRKKVSTSTNLDRWYSPQYRQYIHRKFLFFIRFTETGVLWISRRKLYCQNAQDTFSELQKQVIVNAAMKELVDDVVSIELLENKAEFVESDKENFRPRADEDVKSTSFFNSASNNANKEGSKILNPLFERNTHPFSLVCENKMTLLNV